MKVGLKEPEKKFLLLITIDESKSPPSVRVYQKNYFGSNNRGLFFKSPLPPGNSDVHDRGPLKSAKQPKKYLIDNPPFIGLTFYTEPSLMEKSNHNSRRSGKNLSLMTG